MAKLKVLVTAEAANPEWASVPLVGWSMADALRAVADVHIVTQARNREAFVRAGLVEGRDFTSIDTERLAGPAYKLATLLRGGGGKGWTTVTAVNSLVYPYYEHLLWQRFGRAIEAGEYDVVHRLTPLTPTAVSRIAVKCQRARVPFIVGPLNGGVPWPRAFDAERRKEREWLSYVRGVYKLNPGRRAMYAASRAIIVGSRHTATEIPAEFADRVFYMPENGIDPSRFGRVAEHRDFGELRLCFIGRFVPYKGADMALEAALPMLKGGKARFDLIGDGPMRAALEEFVAREGIGDRVTFHGWVPHDQVQEIACRSSIFVFPSVREFGGGAVLEAMALGLAPVIVDYGGPGELVGADRGIAVPVGERAAIVAAVRAALQQFAAQPALAQEIGMRARAWVMSTLTWAHKAERMVRLYRWARGETTIKPEL